VAYDLTTSDALWCVTREGDEAKFFPQYDPGLHRVYLNCNYGNTLVVEPDTGLVIRSIMGRGQWHPVSKGANLIGLLNLDIGDIGGPKPGIYLKDANTWQTLDFVPIEHKFIGSQTSAHGNSFCFIDTFTDGHEGIYFVTVDFSQDAPRLNLVYRPEKCRTQPAIAHNVHTGELMVCLHHPLGSLAGFDTTTGEMRWIVEPDDTDLEWVLGGTCLLDPQGNVIRFPDGEVIHRDLLANLPGYEEEMTPEVEEQWASVYTMLAGDRDERRTHPGVVSFRWDVKRWWEGMMDVETANRNVDRM
jgi:hypothetical protein